MVTKTKKLVLCAVCAALTCAVAPLSVPIAGLVPISLATFAVLFSGILLGGRMGAVSQAVYLLIGTVGLPVFAGYTSGIGRLLGPTGGYLIGYVPMAFVAGALYYRFGRHRTGGRKYAMMLLAMLAGEGILYLFGTAWFCIVTGTGVLAALMSCVLPFLLGDAAKITAVMLVTPSLERAASKLGVLPAPTAHI